MCSHWVWVLAEASAKVFMHCACLGFAGRFRDMQPVCEHLTVDSDTDYVFPVIYIYLYDSFYRLLYLQNSQVKFPKEGSFPDDIKVSKRKCPQTSSISKAYMALWCHNDIKFHLSALYWLNAVDFRHHLLHWFKCFGIFWCAIMIHISFFFHYWLP